MIQPIHTATIGEHQLRFFRRPINDGKPDLPWHAVEDLHRCLGLNRDLRKHFLHRLRAWKEPRTVATADGIVTVAPLYMPQGCIDAMVEEGMVPDAPAPHTLCRDRGHEEADGAPGFWHRRLVRMDEGSGELPRMTGGSEMFGLGSPL